MIRIPLYATRCVQDGQPIQALSFLRYDGPGIDCRPVATLVAPEGTTLENRPHGDVIVLHVAEGRIVLSAIDAAQQAEVGGCGLSLATSGPLLNPKPKSSPHPQRSPDPSPGEIASATADLRAQYLDKMRRMKRPGRAARS